MSRLYKNLTHKITHAEKYGPALEIFDLDEAADYFESLVDHSMGWGKTRIEAKEIEKRNLGTFADTHSREVGLRFAKLFGVTTRWTEPK